MESHRVGHDWCDLAAAANYVGGNENNGDLLQKIPCTHCYTHCSQPWSRPPPTQASARESWTLMGKSGSVFCGVPAPFSWVLVHTRSSLCFSRAISQSCVSSGSSMVDLPPLEMLKHSSVSVSEGSLGPGAHKVCLSPLSISDGNGVWF